MNIRDAKQFAISFIEARCQAPGGDRYLIVDAGVKEDSEGWYFPYQTERFLVTRDIRFSVVGNWPVFVSKDGRVVEPRRPPLPES